MNPEKWKELFRRGTESGELRLTAYPEHPQKLDTPERIRYYDSYAARYIAVLEAAIETLQSYRAALAARYAELDTMLYTTTVSLVRHCGYSGKGITYTLRIYRTYEDGTKQDTRNTNYIGKDRKLAFADFEKIKSEHRDYIVHQDTDKKSWER